MRSATVSQHVWNGLKADVTGKGMALYRGYALTSQARAAHHIVVPPLSGSPGAAHAGMAVCGSNWTQSTATLALLRYQGPEF